MAKGGLDDCFIVCLIGLTHFVMYSLRNKERKSDLKDQCEKQKQPKHEKQNERLAFHRGRAELSNAKSGRCVVALQLSSA